MGGDAELLVERHLVPGRRAGPALDGVVDVEAREERAHDLVRRLILACPPPHGSHRWRPLSSSSQAAAARPWPGGLEEGEEGEDSRGLTILRARAPLAGEKIHHQSRSKQKSAKLAGRIRSPREKRGCQGAVGETGGPGTGIGDRREGNSGARGGEISGRSSCRRPRRCGDGGGERRRTKGRRRRGETTTVWCLVCGWFIFFSLCFVSGNKSFLPLLPAGVVHFFSGRGRVAT